jgi:hypothetical protein
VRGARVRFRCMRRPTAAILGVAALFAALPLASAGAHASNPLLCMHNDGSTPQS